MALLLTLIAIALVTATEFDFHTYAEDDTYNHTTEDSTTGTKCVHRNKTITCIETIKHVVRKDGGVCYHLVSGVQNCFLFPDAKILDAHHLKMQIEKASRTIGDINFIRCQMGIARMAGSETPNEDQ